MEVITTCWALDVKPWIGKQVHTVCGYSFIVERETSACRRRVFIYCGYRDKKHNVGGHYFTADREKSACLRRVFLYSG